MPLLLPTGLTRSRSSSQVTSFILLHCAGAASAKISKMLPSGWSSEIAGSGYAQLLTAKRQQLEKSRWSNWKQQAAFRFHRKTISIVNALPLSKGNEKTLSLSLSSFCNSKWGKDMCPLASCHAPSRDWTDVPKTLLNTSWIMLFFLPDFCHLSLQAAVLSEVVCSSQHHIPVGWSTWSTLSLAFESCLVFLLFGDLWSTMRLSSPHPAGPRMHTESYWVKTKRQHSCNSLSRSRPPSSALQGPWHRTADGLTDQMK